MADHHERRRHFRGKPRPGRVLEIRHRAAGAAWCLATTRNIGVGGAFIEGGADLRTGLELELELRLPGSDLWRPLNAIVRRIEAGPPPGFGVEFIDVEVDVLLELNDYFASLTGSEAE
ncbi:MAG: PilZ domain-containing protein [Deltaproteobacteria bacterium]|nr:PilZ domain-containing protein [Deltaproteobacteria bacterium]